MLNTRNCFSAYHLVCADSLPLSCRWFCVFPFFFFACIVLDATLHHHPSDFEISIWCCWLSWMNMWYYRLWCYGWLNYLSNRDPVLFSRGEERAFSSEKTINFWYFLIYFLGNLSHRNFFFFLRKIATRLRWFLIWASIVVCWFSFFFIAREI